MGLNLQASQQYLKGIYGTSDVFIIPSYQRAYSWEYDQCSQLFTDIIEAFESGTEFFVGNILMAKSPVEKNRPQIEDGQQRLLTLWLMFKVMMTHVIFLIFIRWILTSWIASIGLSSTRKV